MKALLVDIGNSRIKWRLVDPYMDDESSFADGADAADNAVALNDIARIADHWRTIARQGVDVALISNVAHADIEAAVIDAISASWPAARVERIVPASREGGLVNSYDDPSQLGPDRWLALIGAHALLPRRSLLVCTFGTATTIDLVTVGSSDEAGGSTAGATPFATFVGGLILPGFAAMRASLKAATARLPDAQGSVATFGTDTVDCIASGIAAAQWGAVERSITHAGLLRNIAPVTCLFAGGALPEVAPLIDSLAMPHRIAADLVLRGLAVVARRFDVAERRRTHRRVA